MNNLQIRLITLLVFITGLSIFIHGLKPREWVIQIIGALIMRFAFMMRRAMKNNGTTNNKQVA